jgi:lipopolysaccharide biosynthesis protein
MTWERQSTGRTDPSLLPSIIAELEIGDEFFWEPERLVQFEHWAGHIPFAFWLVNALKPKVLVELGTHRGNSYCAFCQAIKATRLECRAFAVDTWAGDMHMAPESGLLSELQSHHDPRYASFSTLLQKTFDEARPIFEPGTVDVLHIDGTHTYESVQHDFETWLPALSDRGIVLFHDTNVHRDDYGVWKLWSEVSLNRPHFDFFHSYGLGVLGVGESFPEKVRSLFDLAGKQGLAFAARSLFAARGEMLSSRVKIAALEKTVEEAQTLLTRTNDALEQSRRESANLQARFEAENADFKQRSWLARQEADRVRAALSHKIADLRSSYVAALDELGRDRQEYISNGSSPRFGARRAGRPAPEIPGWKLEKQNGRIAVVVHLHYVELWPELAESISATAEPFDLFVSLTSESSQIRSEILKMFPKAAIAVFENRGRDILPFVSLVNTGLLFEYELVCKLHGKRSLHRVDGDHWRRTLVEGVLGSRNLVSRIVGSFDSDSDLGMVVADGQIYGWEHWHWAGNLERVRSLGARVGISEIPDGVPFPGGSVYWVRPFILRHLAALSLAPDDFEPEPLPPDGTTAHAVERLLGLICRDAGMSIVESGQLSESRSPQRAPVRKPQLIAFYLPQYHPIPENDRWWGKGFSEWVNVTRALPMFENHRQPRVPADLGFYDLRVAEVRCAQAELARQYGISAFCYYYYWFDGRKLLERPLQEVIQSGSPDFPFLICWANEPWSRNWDGGNREVLVPQTYGEGWVETFAEDVAPVLLDHRYFRVDEKPVLLIYRAMHIPDCASSLAKLRTVLLQRGVEKVHLVAGWLHLQEDTPPPADPRDLGVDAYFEFPPHGLELREVTEKIPVKVEGFAGHIHSYDSAIRSSLGNFRKAGESNRYHGVMVSWDNTARLLYKSHIVHGATPAKFRGWLRQIVRHSEENQDVSSRLIFINAWNEWAEGTYLEPDSDYGHGWLEAVASASGQSLRSSAARAIEGDVPSSLQEHAISLQRDESALAKFRS